MSFCIHHPQTLIFTIISWKYLSMQSQTLMKTNGFHENTNPWSPGPLWKTMDCVRIPVPGVPNPCENQWISWEDLSLESGTLMKTNGFHENTRSWVLEPYESQRISWKYSFLERWALMKTNGFDKNTCPWSPEPLQKPTDFMKVLVPGDPYKNQ